jgi:hypothetical protein
MLEENGTVVVIVAAFAAVLITHLRTALAADGWMALLSGRVVAHGLPSHDTLTIWAHGRTWVDQQWLAQLALYELQRLGGLRLVLLVHAALVTLGLGGAAVLARRLGGSARSTTWVALPVLVAFWPGAAVMRPQSFAYALFVGVLWLLLDDLRLQSSRAMRSSSSPARSGRSRATSARVRSCCSSHRGSACSRRRMRPRSRTTTAPSSPADSGTT